MLVALVITLMMMGAVVTLFGVISESVSASRAGIEMSDRLRAARNQLQADLLGATASTTPPLRPENDEGYFEVIEGPMSDFTPTRRDPMHSSLFGDVDDVLMFTVRNTKAPFVGKFNGTSLESPLAEVIYFLVQNGPVIDATSNPPTRLCTLYRRVLLVAPTIPDIQSPPLSLSEFLEFYDNNDLSVHYYENASGTPTLVANTLGDLTKRENRFAHYGKPPKFNQFPFLVDTSALPRLQGNNPATWVPFATPTKPPGWPNGKPEDSAFIAPFDSHRPGDDVLLNNVLAFDVRLWDPGAPLFVVDGVPLEPSDMGYLDEAKNWASSSFDPSYSNLAGWGAHVDLGYFRSVGNVPPSPLPYPQFGSIPVPKSQIGSLPFIYDTWSLHYESNGVNEDNGIPGDFGADSGTNGVNDNSDQSVDESGLASQINVFNASGDLVDISDYQGEYDTLPPYPWPLRGVQVTIRVYEPDSQQIREAVISQDFVPQ